VAIAFQQRMLAVVGTAFWQVNCWDSAPYTKLLKIVLFDPANWISKKEAKSRLISVNVVEVGSNAAKQTAPVLFPHLES
jgi:hypothetical protein